MDEIDRKILKELQLDARTSYAELGRRVGLTTPAVTERVRKLEDAGIIAGYRAEIDTARVGLPITAFIRMSIVGVDYSHIIEVAQEAREAGTLEDAAQHIGPGFIRTERRPGLPVLQAVAADHECCPDQFAAMGLDPGA